MRTARDAGADDEVLDALEGIPDREYDGPTGGERGGERLSTAAIAAETRTRPGSMIRASDVVGDTGIEPVTSSV